MVEGKGGRGSFVGQIQQKNDHQFRIISKQRTRLYDNKAFSQFTCPLMRVNVKRSLESQRSNKPNSRITELSTNTTRVYVKMSLTTFGFNPQKRKHARLHHCAEELVIILLI